MRAVADLRRKEEIAEPFRPIQYLEELVEREGEEEPTWSIRKKERSMLRVEDLLDQKSFTAHFQIRDTVFDNEKIEQAIVLETTSKEFDVWTKLFQDECEGFRSHLMGMHQRARNVTNKPVSNCLMGYLSERKEKLKDLKKNGSRNALL